MSRPLRICLLSYRGNPYCGGQGVYVTRLGQQLAALGHQVHLISGPPYPPPVEGIILHRVEGLGLFSGHVPGYLASPIGGLSPLALYERTALKGGLFPEISAFSFRALFKLARLLKDHPFDIIHDNQTLGWGSLALKAMGLPLITTIHHPLSVDRQRAYEPPTSFGHRLGRTLFFPVAMQRLAAPRLGTIVTVSQASRRQIIQDFAVPERRIKVVANGVDFHFFRPDPAVAKVAGRVLYVGNMTDPNKGVRYLLRALPLLPPESHLMVVSAASGVPEWAKEELNRLGVAHRVRLASQVEPHILRRHYQQAQVAVSPSLFEGFGLPAAEAMACGLPLVASDGGSLPEVVGEGGLITPARDPAALAAALTRLLQEPALRQQLGQAARARVERLYSWEQAARQMEALYREEMDAHH